MTAHSKLEIARAQLESAVLLVIADQDRISAITLAGAADVILSQLLLNEGKKNFSDHLMKRDADTTGAMPERAAQGRAINDMLRINALMHMDPGDDDYLEMDVFVSSLATVSKAVVNYVSLAEPDADFVQGFKLWAAIHTSRGLDEEGRPR